MQNISDSPMAMAHGPAYSVITMSYWCRQLFTVSLRLILPGCRIGQGFFARLWPLATITPSNPDEGIRLQARHGNGSLRIRSLGLRASCLKAATAQIATVLNPGPASAAQTILAMVSSSTKAGMISTPCSLIWTAHLTHSLEGLFDLGGTDSYSLPQEQTLPANSYPADDSVMVYPKVSVFADR